MRSRAKVLLAVASLCALLLSAGIAIAADSYVPDGSFSSPGSDPGQLNDPKRAALEQSSGNLFVANQGNGRIDVFKPNGDPLTSFGEAELEAPFGIAISESGGNTTVYVSDAELGKVQRFDSDEQSTPSFTLDATYPGPALGSGPEAVGNFAAPLALAPNGELWVADKGDDKLQRYDSSGAYVAGSAIDGSTSPAGAFTGLLDLAVDPQGRIYAIDSDGPIENSPDLGFATGQSRLERFAPDGAHQLTLGGMNRPATVAVNPATDEVAVSAEQTAVDTNESPSLHVFDSSGTQLSSTRMGEEAIYSTVHGLAFESSTPRIWSVNDAGYYPGETFYGEERIHRFASIEMPEAEIEAPENVEQSTATFKATLDLKGETTTARFEVSIDNGASWSTAGETTACEVTSPGECEGPTQVTLAASGLTPDTPYEVRVRGVVRGAAGPPSPSSESFTTLALLTPQVTIEAADPSYVSAKASGTVDPGGADPILNASTCRFEYVTQAQFEADGFAQAEPNGQTAACDVEPSGSGPASVNVELTNLKHSTIYHLRLLAANNAGLSESAEAATFETLAVVPPSVTLDPASNVTAESARLSGNVDPGGSDEAFKATCRFEYLTAAQYAPGDEVQKMAIFATEGEYTLIFEGEETAPIVFNASPAAIQAALEALPNVGPGDVSVSAVSALGQSLYRISFSGALGGRNITDFQIDRGTLAHQSGATATLEAITEGHPAGFFEVTQAPCVPNPVQGPAQGVVADLTELEPNTIYHFRLRAQNLAGVTFSGEQTFKTLTSGPTVAAGTVGALTSDSARLTAYVDANNTPTTATFEYDTDPSFSSPTMAPDGPGATVSGNGSQVAFVVISGLTPEATYHWRVSVESSEGTDDDTAPRGFAPWPTPPAKGDGVGAFGDRVIERVSGDGVGSISMARLSEDGNKVLYRPASGLDASEYGRFAGGDLIATRGEHGWRSVRAFPPRSVTGAQGVLVSATSPDLTRFFGFVLPRAGAPVPYPTFHASLGGDEVKWGVTFPFRPETFVVSHDISRVMAAPLNPLVPEDPAPQGGLYEVSGPEPELIGFLPNGEAPVCGVGEGMFASSGNSIRSQNWASHDGKRVFFHTRGNDCSSPPQLYMREGGADGETTLISGSVLSGPDTGGRFVQATPDGSKVFFTSSSALDPADSNESADLYRHDLGEGNTCITCAVPDPQLHVPSGPAGPSEILVAQDGSRAYFTSNSRLAPGAAKGASNMYVWRASEPGEIAYVGPFNRFVATGGRPNIMATGDGSVVIVASTREELDPLTGTRNGGKGELYRYDDRDGTLACVSCPLEGVEPTGARLSEDGFGDAPMPDPTGLATGGRVYSFTTAAALVPEDVNQAQDVYEWREGVVGLVSDGREPGGIEPRDLSEDGRSLVFEAARRLTADSPDKRRTVYVARIGGGFPEVPPPTPCAGDGCQDTPATPPAAPSTATNQFSGPGNRVEKPQKRCSRGKAKRKGRCVKRKASTQRQQNQKSKGKNKRAGNKQGGSK